MAKTIIQCRLTTLKTGDIRVTCEDCPPESIHRYIGTFATGVGLARNRQAIAAVDRHVSLRHVGLTYDAI